MKHQVDDRPAAVAETSMVVWVERLAMLTRDGEGDTSAAIGDILAAVAESLQVEATLVARWEDRRWSIAHLHDSAGPDPQAGELLPWAEALTRACEAGPLASLIVEDVQLDARLAGLASPPRQEVGVVTAVLLHDAGGALYGALCTLHPARRSVQSGELPMLRLAGRMVMQTVESAALRERERRASQLAVIVEQSSDAIFRVAMSGQIETWNAAATRLYGYSAGEVIGLAARTLLPADRAGELPRLIEQLESGRDIVNVETVHLRKNGNTVDVSLTLSAIRDGEGRLIGHSAIVRDIGERTRAQREQVTRAMGNAELYAAEQARAAEELARVRAEQALEAQVMATLGAALADTRESEQVYQLILEEAAHLIPYHVADVCLYEEGWCVIAASAGDQPLPVGTRCIRVEGSERGWLPPSEDVSYLPDTDEEPRWRHVAPRVGEFRVRSHISMPFTFDGAQVGCFTLGSYSPRAYDEYHLRLARVLGERAAQALRNARLYHLEQERARAAEHLAALRSEFVAAASHELRTPLAAALGYAEVLEGRWGQMDDAQRRSYVQRIVMATNRQKRLIDDLLQASTLQSAALMVRCEAVSLSEVVARAAEIVTATYVGQPVDATGPPDVTAMADPSRMEQILVNLLDNAAKYSPEGSSITVRWRTEDGMAVVRVSDHGPGISEEGRSVIFTRFGRLKGSRMRAGRVGTGLGLYLGRAYAEAMGGSLDLESTGAGGSTFCLRLPGRRPE